LNEGLAVVFRKNGNEFKPVLREMFMSQEFYAPSIIRNQVKSPVQWLVGTCRVLERPLPPPLACFTLTRNLGQDLFAPPNVKGWDGGLSWITTNNLLARYNEAAALVKGDMSGAGGGQMTPNAGLNAVIERRLRNIPAGRVDVEKLFTETERNGGQPLIGALEKRLLQDHLKPKQEQVLKDYVDSQEEMNDDAIRSAIRLVMSTPEYQLC